jgi:hypothetical protein
MPGQSVINANGGQRRNRLEPPVAVMSHHLEEFMAPKPGYGHSDERSSGEVKEVQIFFFFFTSFFILPASTATGRCCSPAYALTPTRAPVRAGTAHCNSLS